MHVGNSFIFAHPDGLDGGQAGDAAVYASEYRLADRAEQLGFDSVWGVEHHFNGYAMCPDPLKFLTYVAARTSRVKLGSMVVVAPWHHPIRVAEDVSVLDQISGGRVILGMGRGVSKMEFDGFGLDMNLSRQQLIENTEAVMMGLQKGHIEYDGEVLQQPHVLIRPMPQYSFENRLYLSAQSAETFPIMARLGAGLLFIPGNRPYEQLGPELEAYRELFRAAHGREAPQPIFVAWTFVDEDRARAHELGPQYITRYSMTAMSHYAVSGEHMKSIKGYENYAANAEKARAAGITQDDSAKKWTGNHVFGTPDECVEKAMDIQQKLGACAYLAVFNYAGMGEAEAARNQSLFADKVLPRLKAYEPQLDIGQQVASLAAV
jgi:alkanesulfonate monooxygenase SsuD/methylene tetrahydromethanopterin reductase-like flavin-dependent oxidoreductase (luciferase family)